MQKITGIISKNGFGAHSNDLTNMLMCMVSEPIYSCGRYINEPLGVWLGWASRKENLSTKTPAWNESKNVCLLFAGEDFRDTNDLFNLRRKGHEFDNKNFSYLVHIYEETGKGFFEKLNGCFSGILIDFRDKKIRLFNDRFGLKRIYYYETKDAFYFSSEAKSLLQIFPTLRQFDYKSLAEYFSCGCVLQNRTLFQGISIVPAGSCWEFDHGCINKAMYFDVTKYQQQEPLSEADFYDELKETWAKILPKYIRDDDNLAISLTGGVDCRMILAWAERDQGELPCYTFGGMLRDSEDVKIARILAKKARQQHKVIRIDNTFFAQFPKLAEETIYITDGAMGVGGSADLFVNRLAREIAQIRITGNYGQEILRSSIAFRPVSLCEKIFNKSFIDLLREAEKTYFDEIKNRKLSFIVSKQFPWHHLSRFSLESSQLTIRSPYIDNDIVGIAYRMPLNAGFTKEFSLRLISEGKLDLSEIGTDRGVLYGPMNIFKKLSKQYHAFSFKAEYAFDYGMPQWLALIERPISILHPERLFLGRHKFTHFRVWYREMLSGYVKEILLDTRSMHRTYLNDDYISTLVNRHIKGLNNFTKELHALISVELIQRKLIDI